MYKSGRAMFFKATKHAIWHTIKIVLCGIALAATACSSQQEPAHEYSVSIKRTTHGIPHITAETEASAAFGAGYVYAEDNLCLLIDMIRTVRGERSKYFGPDAVKSPDVDTGVVKSSNLNSDFFYKLMNSPENLEATWATQPAFLKENITAYVAGVNYIIDKQTSAGTLPVSCANAPWLQKVTVLDIMALMRRYASEASLRFMEAIIAAKPPTINSAQGRDEKVAAPQIPEKSESPLGSNAIAFGSAVTKSGQGLLLANPHLPWYGSLRFYQMHLTVPDTMDVMGVTFAGLPNVLIGFTEDFAWTHTVNTSSHYSVFSLKTGNDGTTYTVDGEERPIMRKKVTVELPSTPEGTPAFATHDFWLSEYGPLIQAKGQFEWSNDIAYALKDANLGNGRLLEAWNALNKAHSLEEADKALKRVVGLPWVNTIAVSREGTAYYANMSVIPSVSNKQLEDCVAEPFQQNLRAGKFIMFVLDGSRSACTWQHDIAAPQDGIISGDNLISLERDDFVQNSNDSAWLTNPSAPITDAPLIVSGSEYPQNGRTRLGLGQTLSLIHDKKGQISPRDIKNLLFNNISLAGPSLMQAIPSVCQVQEVTLENGSVQEIKKACDVLAKWQGTAELDDVGYILAQTWLRNLKREKHIWQQPFDTAAPITTPTGFAYDKPDVLLTLRLTLAKAVRNLAAQNVPFELPLSSIQVALVPGEAIPIHGGDADDIYNVTDGVLAQGKKVVRAGASYVAIVSYDEAGVSVESVLSYGQSSNPQSPYYSEETHMFSNKEWTQLPFKKADINANLISEEITVTHAAKGND